MTTTYVDLKDPARVEVSQRALTARSALDTVRQRLVDAGYEQVRFDQWQHPKTRTLVETGYTYGETRLVVHESKPDYVSPAVTDFRMVGGDQQPVRMHEFLNLTGCSLSG